MQGYWNLPEQTARALPRRMPTARAGTGPATSSSKAPDGNYIYLGRRDRMVKRRGYRVELGEIEAGPVPPPAIKEAAVVALRRRGSGRAASRRS